MSTEEKGGGRGEEGGGNVGKPVLPLLLHPHVKKKRKKNVHSYSEIITAPYSLIKGQALSLSRAATVNILSNILLLLIIPDNQVAYSLYQIWGSEDRYMMINNFR